MRLKRGKQAIVVLALAGAWAFPAAAQSPDTLMPEESAAKARHVMQEAIQALGGAAYLGVKDYTCTGRTSSFEHNGSVTGTAKFSIAVKFPDKERTEFFYKTYTDIIIAELHKTLTTMEVHNGDHGWTLNGEGVLELPPDTIAAYKEQRKKNVNVILRERMNEPGLSFRWAGFEIIDLRRVEWVEFEDEDHHTVRIAFDEQTHLPSRVVNDTLNPATREHDLETEYFGNYHPVQGIGTAFQRYRERNGLKYFQVFYDECKYNTSPPDSIFTPAALEQQFAHLYHGKKH